MPTWEDLLGTPYGKATPEQIKRAQEHAYALLKPRETPNRSWAAPIGDVLNAIAGAHNLNTSTMGDYDQRQQAGRIESQLDTQMQGRGSPLATGSLPPPQIAMNAPSPTPQPEAPVSPEVTTVPGQAPQMTPDDGTKLPLPTQAPTITGTGNPTEQPKTGFKLDSYIKRLFEVESGNNPAARKGSYRGLAQFSPDLEKKYGINDENWQDPTVQINAAARHAIESSQEFKRKFGHDPSEGEMYLMHQQGVNGGTALLGSSPNAPAYKTLAEASGATEAVAKQRVASNIPTGNELSKKPVEAITNQEFSRLWVNKFDKGETSPYQAMRLGGPTEETAPVGPQGQQVAQNTVVPPAVRHPAGNVDPDTLAQFYSDPRISNDHKEMVKKMMIEGATPAARDSALGKEEFRPSNPGETSRPGATATSSISLHGITIPTVMTRLPNGQMVNQFMLPNGELVSAEKLMEWGRKQSGLDTRQGIKSTEYAKRENEIQLQSESAAANRQKLSLARQFAEDPNSHWYSGTGANKVLDYAKIASYVTGDPNWSGNMEAFSKVMAGANISGLQAFKGYGQIRNPEIELLQKSQGDINNSPGAIKAIIRMNERASQRIEEIGQEMRKYRKEHGQLDEGFDEEMAKFYKDKPLFSDNEMKNYREVLFNEKPSNQNLGAGFKGVRKPVDEEGYTKYPSGRIRQIQ